jgi:peptidoglycan-N-acetylglucosamine deacetylase
MEQEHGCAVGRRTWRRRKANLRRQTKALVALAVAGAPLSLLLALSGCGHRSQLSVKIAGRAERVPEGTTLAEGAASFDLRPKAGDLLDVHGRVLRAGVFPGWLLLDGRPAPDATRLNLGDRVEPVAGRDRVEPLRRQLVPVPGGAPSDPQFLLARTPGVQVVVRGALSHELVSVRFRPRPGRQTVERAVALSFDDGPSPSDTPRILALLRRLHVPATFFVIGYLAERYPQLVALEHQQGMAIGNHTYNHPEVPPFAELPRRLIKDEIALGARSLTRLGIHPRLLRPPGGSASATVVRAAQALGERIVLWSVDPTDWRPGVTATQITHRVLRAVRPGSIVILHDGGGDRSATVAALPAIVKGIRRKGLRLVEIAAR